jgi:DNA-binding MarR family transcriptional regulator
VSRIVDQLVEAGYVRREANADDARSAYATITPAGRRRFAAAAPAYVRAIATEFAAGLTAAELHTIADGLNRTAERIESR